MAGGQRRTVRIKKPDAELATYEVIGPADGTDQPWQVRVINNPTDAKQGQIFRATDPFRGCGIGSRL